MALKEIELKRLNFIDKSEKYQSCRAKGGKKHFGQEISGKYKWKNTSNHNKLIHYEVVSIKVTLSA